MTNSTQTSDFAIGPLFIIIPILLLAAAAIGVIWYGTVLRNRRRNAEQQVVEDYETAEAHGATTEPTSTINDEGTVDLSADAPKDDARAGAPEPAPTAVVTPPATASNLAQIKGLGPKLVALLGERGITQVAQLAAFSPEQAADLDAQLGTFQGRMARDRWIEQARLLQAGDRAGYEAAFGKLGG